MKNILAIIFIMSIKMAFSQPTDIERLRPQIDKYLSLVMANGFEKYGFYYEMGHSWNLAAYEF